MAEVARSLLAEPLPPVRSARAPAEMPRQSAGAKAVDAETLDWARAVRSKRRSWTRAGLLVLAIGGTTAVLSLIINRQRVEEDSEQAITVTTLPAIAPRPAPTPVARTEPARERATAAPAASAITLAAAPAGSRSVEIEVVPPKSLIFHKTRKLGKSPLTIQVPPGEKLLLLIAHDGYQPQRITVDGTEPKLSVTLGGYPGGDDSAAEPGLRSPPNSSRAKASRPWEPEEFAR